jgi:hypothetical protein
MGLLYLYFFLSGMANEPVMFSNSTEHRVAACCHIASFNIGISNEILIKVILARN